MKVFLGGTCNESTWRDRMIFQLRKHKMTYFNPVVDDWGEEAQANELKERENCDICLYTITPKMTGVYSVAEVVDDSNKRPQKTVFVLLKNDDGIEFSKSQWRSLLSVAHMVERNGGHFFEDLESSVLWIKNLPTVIEQTIILEPELELN